MKIYIALLCLAGALSACSVSKTADDIADSFRKNSDPNAYAESVASGKVFGQDWTAVTAVATPFGTDNKQLSVSLYAENVTSACKSPVTKKPYASVVIPRDYTTTEYVFDMATGTGGNPLVFIDMNNGATNLIADFSKIRINSVNATGFEASVFATGTEVGGAKSQINGKIQVMDCTKAADFSVWNDFIAWYTLTTFDGVSVTPRTAIVEKNSRSFYDRQSARYINVITFPLYDWVASGSDSSMTFGPMEGLGQTTVSEKDGVKTLTYSYHGPINYRSTDVTLNLDMSVAKSSSGLAVNYTLEVPNYIKSTTHRFTLTK